MKNEFENIEDLLSRIEVGLEYPLCWEEYHTIIKNILRKKVNLQPYPIPQAASPVWEVNPPAASPVVLEVNPPNDNTHKAIKPKKKKIGTVGYSYVKIEPLPQVVDINE